MVATGMDSDQIVKNVLGEVGVAGASRAEMSGGGTIVPLAERETPEVERDLGEWYPGVGSQVRETGADAARFVSQVGPLDTGYIAFSGGVPVGGSSQLTLFQSGHINFTGHFHVSGLPSYNVGFAVGVRSRRGVLYTFLRTGHVAGTLEPGSRDFNWSVQDFRDIIREDWPNIAVGSTWWWSAKVNWDPMAIVGSVKALAETVGAVASVVALL